jgi:hypothetical protein
MHRVVSDRERERERERKKKRKRSVRARVYTRIESTHLVRAANATSCNLERSSMAEFNEFNGALLLSSSSSTEEEEEDALAHKPRERHPLLLLLFVVFFFPREVMKPPAQGRRVWLTVASIFSAFGEKKWRKSPQKKEESLVFVNLLAA